MKFNNFDHGVLVKAFWGTRAKLAKCQIRAPLGHGSDTLWLRYTKWPFDMLSDLLIYLSDPLIYLSDLFDISKWPFDIDRFWQVTRKWHAVTRTIWVMFVQKMTVLKITPLSGNLARYDFSCDIVGKLRSSRCGQWTLLLCNLMFG